MKLSGKIKKLKKVRTLKGDEFAFVKLYNDSIEYELICFPAAWTLYRMMIKTGIEATFEVEKHETSDRENSYVVQKLISE